MSPKIFLSLFLTCLLYTSAYGNEPVDYLWQQEAALCLVTQECIVIENTARDNREKCLQLAQQEEVENNFVVIGDSCSTGKEPAEEVTNTLSAIFTSIKKSLTEIDYDFSLAESVDIILLYAQTSRNTVIPNATDKKTTGASAEHLQVKTEPVILIRLKSNMFFDFTSKKINNTGSTIIRHLVSDVLATSPRYKKISVVGHTDNVGAAKNNLRLSKERSDIVVAELQKQLRRLGDAANTFQIKSMGVGESQPIEHTEREMESQANRRLEIFLSPSSLALHKTEKCL